MNIQKSRARKSTLKTRNSRIAAARRRALRASEKDTTPEIDVAPEASTLLFEAGDVAELLAEVTGEDIAVTVEDDAVTYEVGDDEFVVEADGDEEVLESATRVSRGRKVRASRRPARKARR